jgi:hypothetical protein
MTMMPRIGVGGGDGRREHDGGERDGERGFEGSAHENLPSGFQGGPAVLISVGGAEIGKGSGEETLFLPSRQKNERGPAERPPGLFEPNLGCVAQNL